MKQGLKRSAIARLLHGVDGSMDGSIGVAQARGVTENNRFQRCFDGRTRKARVGPQVVRVDLQAVRVGPQAVRVGPQAVRVGLQAVRVDQRAAPLPQSVASRRWYMLLFAVLVSASCVVHSARASGPLNGALNASIHAALLMQGIPVITPSALAAPLSREQRRYGEAVAAAGALVAVGAPTDGDDALTAGRVTALRVKSGASGELTLVTSAEFTTPFGNGGEGDHFGASLAMSRFRCEHSHDACRTTLLAIGADRATAPNTPNGAIAFCGTVEIYRTTSAEGSEEGASEWIHEASISSMPRDAVEEGNNSEFGGVSGPESGAEFGAALAFTHGVDTLLAIGAPRRDIEGKFDAGQVEIFRRDRRIGIDDPMLAASDGSVLATGGPFEPNWSVGDGARDQRRAFASPWVSIAAIHAPSVQASSWFGRSIALNDEWLIVGAPGEDYFGEVESSADDINSCGAVHVYRHTGDAFEFVRTLLAPKPTHAMWFGSALALEGNTFAIGAPNATQGDTHSGAVFLVDLALMEEAPKRIDCPQLADGSGFGQSLAMLEGTLLIGATGIAGVETTGVLIEGVGSCWLYDVSAERWLAELAAPSAHPMALFGSSCALLSASSISSAETNADGVISIAGHLYTEEEAVAPSPGAAFYRSP